MCCGFCVLHLLLSPLTVCPAAERLLALYLTRPAAERFPALYPALPYTLGSATPVIMLLISGAGAGEREQVASTRSPLFVPMTRPCAQMRNLASRSPGYATVRQNTERRMLFISWPLSHFLSSFDAL
ncbi:hypothetical protein NDU88_005507 [Pleurodeles waltl]|uniref:Secreted protein n=1 Tax=Pleurodeles waltl TaxID=8319 RepID=A0AAV7RME3_PLEWA|nr:hypothetical protein NDU88_005507 [Pleurodeles waltl]